jgi:hypothetical protein
MPCRTPRQLTRAMRYLTGSVQSESRVMNELQQISWDKLQERDRERTVETLLRRTVNQEFPYERFYRS